MENKKNCPKCGAEMILKQAKYGIYAGQLFYGCTRFPDCEGKRDYIEYDSKSIRVGSVVTILFMGSGHKKQWTLYSPERESIARTGGIANAYQRFEQRIVNTKNPINDDTISDESPIGRAMLGKHVGDVVSYNAPDGEHMIKILEVINE